MKKKLIKAMLIILGCVIAFSFYNVQATSVGSEGTTEGGNESDIKIELKSEMGIASLEPVIEISNLEENIESRYYLVITSNSNKPNVTWTSDECMSLKYNNTKKIFTLNNNLPMTKYVELGQDLYASILEYKKDGTEEIITFGNKLERYPEVKYADAFEYTVLSYNGTQIVTRFTHSDDNDRKMQIKIGKITDTTILQKIKAQNSSGFAELLSFAKTNNGIYNQTVDTKENSGSIGYEEPINLTGLQNDAYYFLYVKTLDENGKYISSEAVTLAQANVYTNSWYLFFYGSNDFEWADFGNTGTPSTPSTPTDGTTAQGKLPQTGANTIIWTTLAIILIGGTTICHIQYRKNNF